MKRLLAIGTWVALVVAIAVVAAAAAYAAIPSGAGTIAACYGKGSGGVRVVDAEAGEQCLPSEEALSWNQQGVQGPPGMQGPPGETVRGYRVLRATPDEVEVTVVGTGPLGFPEANGTHILEMRLAKGVYMVDASIAARKGFGDGDFLCWVHDNVRSSIFTRTSLGDASGHIKRNTVSGSGVFSIPAGGGTLQLECWQASIAELPGSPSGDNPTVFYATLQATNASQATIVRYPAGTTVELP
jgi:hypothetical protein